MIPSGYLFKRVKNAPDNLESAGVKYIYSVSGCISEAFADYIDFWKHNGFWLFDSPAIIEDLSTQHAIDLSGTTRFYYEVYEREFDVETRQWVPFTSDSPFPTNISVPSKKYLKGFDVVTFSVHNAPECSPLSCNLLAESIPVNQHCLFEAFDETKHALESGAFKKCEPGPYRIFAVYTLDIR